MANLCENLVNISGDAKDILKIKEIIEKAKASKTLVGFYEVLLGTNLQTYLKDKDSSWAEYTTDFPLHGIDYIEFTGDSDVAIGFDSSWSPTLGGSKAICEKYNLAITQEYAESGMNFSGIAKMDENSFSDEEFEGGYYALENELAPEDLRDMVNSLELEIIMDPNDERVQFDSDLAFNTLIGLVENEPDYVELVKENTGFKSYVRFVAGMLEDVAFDESTLGFSDDAIKELEEACLKDILFDSVLAELA